MRDYYRDMSQSAFTLSGAVLNQVNNGIPTWVILSNTKMYYHNQSYAGIFTQFANAVLAAAQAQQGIVPTLDATHKLCIIYAGNMYVANDVGIGQLHPAASGNVYIMNERFKYPPQGIPRNSEVNDATFSHIGVHSHEFGHILGLGDQYYAPYDYGLWGLMANGGNKGGDNDSQRGNNPAPIVPQQRHDLEWLSFQNVDSKALNVQIPYSLNAVYKIKGSYSSEYILVENRQTGNDWNRFLPSGGLLIWCIHYSTVDLIEADGVSSAPYASAGDPFPGSRNVRTLTDFSSPSDSKFISGSNSNVLFQNISNSASTMTADLSPYWYGTISESGTWSGTVVIGENVSVSSGVTLTLDPSTTLTFNSGTSLTVNGTLDANGTSSYPVTFSGPSFTLSGSGSINVGYLTVPSGSTMAVASGTALSFTSGAKLRINSTGVVSANGATFQGSGYRGSWFGIEFYNVTASQSLGYCTIKDASYGLNFINTDVALSHPAVRDNTYGVNCTNYSDPIFTYTVLQTNGWGVDGDASSDPYLGAYLGYDSFRDNDFYDIYSTYSGTIYARSNWWGACPPYPSVTQNVDYSYWLCSDPNPRGQSVATDLVGLQFSKRVTGSSSELISPGVVPTPEPGMSELNTAYLFYVDGKYAEALHAFEAIVAGYPNNFAGRRALVFVERTLDKLGRSNEILATLNSASASYSGKALGEFAEARRVYQYLGQRRYQEAASQAAEIVRLNDNTTLVKFALYDLGSIYWYYIGDTKMGEQYYRQLIARFPKDHLTNSALATLGEWVPEKPAGRASPTLSAGDSRGLLTGYSVSQNYPNPFNPSTVITYQLPTAGYVTMKVYNTLGQEVATLVDAFQDAGIKSVAFDAAPLPSGVYFYRLQSGTFIQNKKMLLVK